MKMKMKKVLTVLVSAVLIAVSVSSFASANEDKSILYLDYGDIVIGNNVVSGYDESGNAVTVPDADGYTVTQKNSSVSLSHSITVASGSPVVEILDINISRSGSFDFAISIESGASPTIIISGENHVKPGPYRAGIDVSQSASVIIEGDGTLYTSSEFEAGIGGGNGKTNGNVTINSGIIYATGGISGYSAGIGGGTAGNGGIITINGGWIKAVGGERAAGIGGGNLMNGGKITINGGCVTAIGGYTAAGIGGGYLGNGGTVVINGGSVKATKGEGGTDIGNGQNCATAFSGIKNSDSQTVSLIKYAVSDYNECYIDGYNTSAIINGHENDDNLYFYLENGEHYLTKINEDSTAKYYKITVTGSTATSNEIVPVDLSNVKSIGNSLIIDDNLGDIIVNDGYSLNTDTDGNLVLKCGDIILNEFKALSLGDVNQDGHINSADALYVLNFCTERMIPDETQKILSDINKDEKITSYDALKILYKSIA